MGLCPVSFIFNYFSSLRVTVQSFAVSSLTWESSPPGVTGVIPGVTHLMFTWRGREKRLHSWTINLKPPNEAKRKGAVFTMSTKAQKAPANYICTGWDQRSVRLFWRAAAWRWSAALWREDANFVSVVITQLGLGSASWMEELNSGFAPLLSLRLHSSAVAFVSLLFLFSWPNIQIWGGWWLLQWEAVPWRKMYSWFYIYR